MLTQIKRMYKSLLSNGKSAFLLPMLTKSLLERKQGAKALHLESLLSIQEEAEQRMLNSKC